VQFNKALQDKSTLSSSTCLGTSICKADDRDNTSGGPLPPNHHHASFSEAILLIFLPARREIGDGILAPPIPNRRAFVVHSIKLIIKLGHVYHLKFSADAARLVKVLATVGGRR
jgi:hypothetical protein